MGELDVVPQDLGRVFLNMVTNSCHATHEKRMAGVEAGSGSDSYFPTVWLTTRRNDEGIEVRIKDNGSGIPDEVIDKIFNPFFTTKPTDQGTGLGLSLCNDIIRQHGGAISVTSEPGESTEMVIELPLVTMTGAAEDGADDDHDDDDDDDDDDDAQEEAEQPQAD